MPKEQPEWNELGPMPTDPELEEALGHVEHGSIILLPMRLFGWNVARPMQPYMLIPRLSSSLN